jgi:hypothetical protein
LSTASASKRPVGTRKNNNEHFVFDSFNLPDFQTSSSTCSTSSGGGRRLTLLLYADAALKRFAVQILADLYDGIAKLASRIFKLSLICIQL